jgi:uncharacterized protein YceK
MKFEDRSFVTFLLIVTIALFFMMMLSGCSTTVPVTAKFPAAPKYSMETCPQLQKLTDDAKLSDVAKTVTINYSTYYECAVKNDAWIEWYQIQKNIFESVK